MRPGSSSPLGGPVVLEYHYHTYAGYHELARAHALALLFASRFSPSLHLSHTFTSAVDHIS